ncbi:MAG: SxtJ family membrane protein [Planctomycetaceae bacterium]
MNVNWNPPVKMLRQFCVLLAAFGTVFVGYTRNDNPVAAWAIFGVTLLVSLIGYFVPAVARVVYVGMMIVTFPIGWVFSHVLLGGIFYLVITPVAIMMKLFGYDPMKRTIDKTASTYWQPHPPITSTKRYFQQY